MAVQYCVPCCVHNIFSDFYLPLSYPHTQKVNLTLLAMKTRANLQRLQSLTYNIDQENAEVLADMNSHLVKLYDDVYQELPNKDGIALRTHRQCNIATIRRKVQKISVKYSTLKRAKSKKMPSNIRKRYGQKADRLRKSYEVCDFMCIIIMYVIYLVWLACRLQKSSKAKKVSIYLMYVCEHLAWLISSLNN